MATQAQSSNYGVSEVEFGSGGVLHACSTSYCAKQSAGELAVGNTSEAAGTLTTAPTADSYILATSPSVNFGTVTTMRSSSANYRSLLKFDTSSIPSTANISSVTLQVYSTNSVGGNYRVHSELDGWTETGVTWANQPTWNATVLNSSVIATTGVMLSITLPASAVTAGGNTNFGLDYSAPAVIGILSTREDASHPPQLTVNYKGGYQAQAGGNTNRDPLLEVNVGATGLDFGILDASAAQTASTTFSVKSNLASGYNVYIDGTALTNSANGATIAPMTTAAPSIPGTSQFGLNLRQNTSPSVGADPVQVPSGAFSYGTAAPGYDTPNYFRSNAGDIIATSTSSSGETDYTMSMIAKRSDHCQSRCL